MNTTSVFIVTLASIGVLVGYSLRPDLLTCSDKGYPHCNELSLIVSILGYLLSLGLLWITANLRKVVKFRDLVREYNESRQQLSNELNAIVLLLNNPGTLTADDSLNVKRLTIDLWAFRSLFDRSTRGRLKAARKAIKKTPWDRQLLQDSFLEIRNTLRLPAYE